MSPRPTGSKNLNKTVKTRHSLEQPQDATYRLIALTKGMNTMVSSHRYEALNRVNWFASWNVSVNGYYARRSGKCGEAILLHRFIMGLEAGDKLTVDHINHDTLDNRDENLRVCSYGENLMNKRVVESLTGFRGVTYDRNTKKFAVRMMVNKKNLYFGQYATGIEAAVVYDKMVPKYRGHLAPVNFPKK